MRPMSLTAPFLALTTTLTLSLAQAQSFRRLQGHDLAGAAQPASLDHGHAGVLS